MKQVGAVGGWWPGACSVPRALSCGPIGSKVPRQCHWWLRVPCSVSSHSLSSPCLCRLLLLLTLVLLVPHSGPLFVVMNVGLLNSALRALSGSLQLQDSVYLIAQRFAGSVFVQLLNILCFQETFFPVDLVPWNPFLSQSQIYLLFFFFIVFWVLLLPF